MCPVRDVTYVSGRSPKASGGFARMSLAKGVARSSAGAEGDWPIMFYVYLLRSKIASDRTYIGFTADLKRRLANHNSGQSAHTSKYLPWEISSYHAFADEGKRVSSKPT